MAFLILWLPDNVGQSHNLRALSNFQRPPEQQAIEKSPLSQTTEPLESKYRLQSFRLASRFRPWTLRQAPASWAHRARPSPQKLGTPAAQALAPNDHRLVGRTE